MTLQKLMDRYIQLSKQYETICITQVINDLRQVYSIGRRKEIEEDKR